MVLLPECDILQIWARKIFVKKTAKFGVVYKGAGPLLIKTKDDYTLRELDKKKAVLILGNLDPNINEVTR